MNALVQHLDGQRARRQPAQRCRDPQPLVVAAAGIESYDEIDAAQTWCEHLKVCRKIVAAAFLARFDNADTAAMRRAFGIERANRRERREDRIAVVGAAASIQLAILDHRDPRPEAFAPARHFGLLVEMAIEEHRARVCDRMCRRYFEHENRRSSLQAHDFDRERANRLLAHPTLGQRDDVFNMAVGFPCGIEMRRLCGNANVIDE